MFKNVKLKRAIKKVVSPVLSGINFLIPKRNDMILLYSANQGINHNLAPVKEYLISHDYVRNYKVICSIESMKYKGDEAGEVKYVNHFLGMFCFFRSGHIFYTTGMLPIKPKPGQIVIYLDHGTAFKSANALSHIHNGYEFYFTYHIAASEAYYPSICRRYGCSEENIVLDGEPVLDRMLTSRVKYDLGDYNKIILWAPTFRQSDYFGYDDSDESLVPLFENNDYDDLNEELAKYNFRLIVKLHPGQNTNELVNQHYSHLDILTADDFDKMGWNLYDLLPQIDYLFADYSSVFIQFLLLNKPMAFIIPDFEEYSKRRGFCFDNPLELMPGPKIVNKTDLYDLFEQIDKNDDSYEEQRLQVKNYIHKFSDGLNTRRILEISKIRQQ